jgi:hypothetical protein
MSMFYGNLSTGYISRFIVGYICMFYFYRRRFETWKRYNYLVAAALDAGFNIAMLLMFVFCKYPLDSRSDVVYTKPVLTYDSLQWKSDFHAALVGK